MKSFHAERERSADALVCRVCSNGTGNRHHRAREMMFGSKEEFEYLECARCKCVQLIEIPDSMSKYYPANYHSFAAIASHGGVRAWLTRARNSYAVTNRGVLGKILSRYFPPIAALRSLPPLQLSEDARILDVGSGSGMLLDAMADLGFRNLVGIDPFLEADVEHPNGVKLLKRTIHEIEGQFDVIMFHHAFEHVASPGPTLSAVHDLLAADGTCLIRIPTVSSYAWQYYGANWVQLDAPRHFYVHSLESLKILAGQAGLEISKVIYDSSAFQFWGSEQYVADIPLFGSRSYSVSPADSIFTKSQIATFEKRATELNRKNLGDQAAFYLTRRD
jgi:2-polyprenyl-3-methyl-5-hydroxy-6-metoxy-1,4-benzoquinol methylase